MQCEQDLFTEMFHNKTDKDISAGNEVSHLALRAVITS